MLCTGREDIRVGNSRGWKGKGRGTCEGPWRGALADPCRGSLLHPAAPGAAALRGPAACCSAASSP
eukprot:12913078-Prorocentrum_lima.AAC.1